MPKKKKILLVIVAAAVIALLLLVFVGDFPPGDSQGKLRQRIRYQYNAPSSTQQYNNGTNTQQFNAPNQYSNPSQYNLPGNAGQLYNSPNLSAPTGGIGEWEQGN